MAAGVFEAIIADLRMLIRLGGGRTAMPSAVIFDSRTLQSTPESGARAGWDGAKRKKGAKVHLAVDTLGQLLAVQVTPANAQDRDQGIDLAVVKLPHAKRGFVLLPRRWVIEWDFGWMSRFRRLARDQERLADVLTGFHLLDFTMLMWKQVLPVLGVL